MTNKAFLNWSGGKDAALAYFKTYKNPQFDIVALFTTIDKQNRRVPMHGVRTELIRLQAESMGVPLIEFDLPLDMSTYGELIATQMRKFINSDIMTAVYGDICLEEVRNYRAEKLSTFAMNAHFPLWKIPQETIMREFISMGFKAVTTCINSDLLDKSFLGKTVDNDFIDSLPEGVDICGENGEYHTFVYDAPFFKRPVRFSIGEKTDTYIDLLPV